MKALITYCDGIFVHSLSKTGLDGVCVNVRRWLCGIGRLMTRVDRLNVIMIKFFVTCREEKVICYKVIENEGQGFADVT